MNETIKKLIYYFHVEEGRVGMHTEIKKIVEINSKDIHNRSIHLPDSSCHTYRRKLGCIKEVPGEVLGYICVDSGVAYCHCGEI